MEHQSAVEALAALAQTHRLAIFRVLVKVGPDGLTAGEIAQAVGIGATSLSFHAKELDRAGLIRSWRDGRNIRYSADIEAMRRLVVFLTDDCCGGRADLCGDILASRTVCTPRQINDAPQKIDDGEPRA